MFKIEKLDDVAGTLEELWVSYNQISTLDGLSGLSNLTTLYISNNVFGPGVLELGWDPCIKAMCVHFKIGFCFCENAVPPLSLGMRVWELCFLVVVCEHLVFSRLFLPLADHRPVCDNNNVKKQTPETRRKENTQAQKHKVNTRRQTGASPKIK